MHSELYRYGGKTSAILSNQCAAYIRIRGIIYLGYCESFAVLEGFQVKFWLILGGFIWLLKGSLIVCISPFLSSSDNLD